MQSMHVRWHFSQSRWRSKSRRFSWVVFFLGGFAGATCVYNSFFGDDAARDESTTDVARVDGVQDDAVKFDLRTVFDVCAGHFCHVFVSPRVIWAISEPQVSFKFCSSFTRQAA